MLNKTPEELFEGWVKENQKYPGLAREIMSGRDENFARVVAENHELGFGRMMQIISDMWKAQDPIGYFDTCLGSSKKR